MPLLYNVYIALSGCGAFHVLAILVWLVVDLDPIGQISDAGAKLGQTVNIFTYVEHTIPSFTIRCLLRIFLNISFYSPSKSTSPPATANGFVVLSTHSFHSPIKYLRDSVNERALTTAALCEPSCFMPWTGKCAELFSKLGLHALKDCLVHKFQVVLSLHIFMRFSSYIESSNDE